MKKLCAKASKDRELLRRMKIPTIFLCSWKICLFQKRSNIVELTQAIVSTTVRSSSMTNGRCFLSSFGDW